MDSGDRSGHAPIDAALPAAAAMRSDLLRSGFYLKDTARSLLRAQGFHGVEPYGTVRRHQAGHQGHKGQHCADANKRQRI
jgi:hypothetical protein